MYINIELITVLRIFVRYTDTVVITSRCLVILHFIYINPSRMCVLRVRVSQFRVQRNKKVKISNLKVAHLNALKSKANKSDLFENKITISLFFYHLTLSSLLRPIMAVIWLYVKHLCTCNVHTAKVDFDIKKFPKLVFTKHHL